MKAMVSKTLAAGALAAVSLFGAANASATVYNPFTVTSPTTGKTFTANKIVGTYNEVVTFNANGTFDASILFDAGQFVAVSDSTSATIKGTGLTGSFGLYATYKTKGTVSFSGGKTVFNFVPGTGSLHIYLDVGYDTDYTAPALGTGNYALTGAGNDVELAYGVPTSGVGTLDPTLSTCGPDGINCGSYGATTSLVLTAAGKSFFVGPNPFYNTAFESGQLNTFKPIGTQSITGSMDVVFGNMPVPEPATLGLMGLGLLGLGYARRRKQS